MQRALGKMVVGNILANAAMRHPGGTAIICSGTGRRFTFAEVDVRANRLAHALRGLGLKRGDTLAFLLSNRAESAEIYFACARTGIVGLPLNYRLADSELIELTRALGATALIYEDRFAAAAERLQASLPRLARCIAVGCPAPAGHIDYEAFLSDQSSEAPDIEIGEDDPFFFSLTSGTTGVPKAYLLSHYSNCAVAFSFQAMDMTRDDVVMTVFPTYGRVGISWIIGSMLYGIPNVLANFEPDEVLRIIEGERITVVNLVPTMAAMLLPAQAAAAADLGSLRAIVFAGASLPPATRDQTIALLCPHIYEYYGMNEMGLLVLSSPADRQKRPDSVGKPIVFSEVTIVSEEGERLGPNRIGEILGRSPLTTTAYVDSPDKSAETFRDGWLHTGDLGYLDADGYVFVVGRKKDMIVTGGQNVYAAEVEDVLLRYPGVADCAVVGLPDDVWGERVTGVIIPAPGASLDAAALDAFCRRYLAGFKTPKEFIVEHETLPRTSTGKIQKFLLVERLSGRRGGALPPSPAFDAAIS
jgi:acyl-CoA synthetase (AMP-forming)/AMP-acid ligase II